MKNLQKEIDLLNKKIFKDKITYFRPVIIIKELAECNQQGEILNQSEEIKNSLIYAFIEMYKLKIDFDKIPEKQIEYLQKLAFDDYLEKTYSKNRDVEQRLFQELKKYEIYKNKVCMVQI